MGKILYTSKTGLVYVVDDPFLEGSFAMRRVRCKEQLLPLKKAILNIGNLILYCRVYHTFIDSDGKLFKYKRKYRVDVVVRKIADCKPYHAGCIIKVANTHCPFVWYRHLNPDEEYAILAKVDNGYILLGFSKREYLRKKSIKI